MSTIGPSVYAFRYLVKMPPIKRQMFRYTEADMDAAIQECRRGVPTSTAAKKFGVPRVTLLNKVKGKTPIKRKMGRTCYLTEETETMLVQWAKLMVKQGFPIGKDNLQDSVKKIVDDLNINAPFKGGRPGKKWYSSFLKRHPDLIARQPQNLTASRALVTTHQLKNWFEEVNTYLRDNNYKDILNEPQRVFNMDETAFFLNPKGNKVLAAKGEKSVYQQVNSDEKECYTVLLGGNAAGDALPPMVIFKYERIPRELSMSVPESWGIGRSDNGWMTMETFYEYMCNIFNKWLNDNNVQRPVVLFIDGHTSHLSFHLSTFCSDNGIILVALFPNATHLLQPMDVAVFRSLKGAWKTAVQSWRLDNIDNPVLRKVQFCPLLNKVLKETLSPELFKNGFRKCGLLPWNPDEVCFVSGKPIGELNELQRMTKIKELETGLKFLDKYIEADKIAQFKGCDEWTGVTEDANLFKFYKNMEKLLKQNNENLPIPPDLTIPDQTGISEVLSPLPYDNGDFNITSDVFAIPNKYTSQNLKTPSKQCLSSTPYTQNITPKKHSSQNPLEGVSASLMTQPSTSQQSIQLENSSKDSVNMIIPSPFKRALFWPTPKENSNKRKKEKVPSVVSSAAWQKYHETKERKKIQLEEEKKRRAEEREKKKKETEEARKLKTTKILTKRNKKNLNKKSKIDSNSSTEEEWIESGNSMDDISDECYDHKDDEENECVKGEDYQDMSAIKQSDYIIVKFPGHKRFHKYVCIVQKVTRKDNIEVMAMKTCDESKTLFKENDKDISIISSSQIIEVLDVPKMIIMGDRIKYKFAKYLDVDG